MTKSETDMESQMVQLFTGLNVALKKGELVLNTGHTYDFDGFLSDGKTTQTTRVYNFANGISIAVDKYSTHGSRSVHVGGFPNCQNEDRPFYNSSTFYYVMKDGLPVANEEEAKLLIKQATGVELPMLTIPQPKKSLTFGFDLDFGSVIGDHEVVVSNFKNVGRVQQKDTISFRHKYEQPTDRDIAEYLIDVINKVDSLDEEFMVEGASSGLSGLREIASRFYKEYAEKLPAKEQRQLTFLKRKLEIKNKIAKQN